MIVGSWKNESDQTNLGQARKESVQTIMGQE